MRRPTRSLAAIALALAVAPAAGAFAARAPLPTLHMTSRSPVTVAGGHFVSGERVRLRLGSMLVVVRADRSGSFVASFATKFDRCGGSIAINAAGARGDGAILKLISSACPPSP